MPRFGSKHPHLGVHARGATACGLRGNAAEISRPTPVLGEYTDEVLRELGLQQAELLLLRERKVIA